VEGEDAAEEDVSRLLRSAAMDTLEEKDVLEETGARLISTLEVQGDNPIVKLGSSF